MLSPFWQIRGLKKTNEKTQKGSIYILWKFKINNNNSSYSSGGGSKVNNLLRSDIEVLNRLGFNIGFKVSYQGCSL